MPRIELYKRFLGHEKIAHQRAAALVEQKMLVLSQQAEDRELALRESEERYRALVECSPDAIIVECERRIVFANTAALKLYGANLPCELLGRGMLSLVASPSRISAAETIRELENSGKPRTEEEQALRIDGEVVDISVIRLLFNYHDRPGIHMVARDISERKSLESRLHFQATHDALTGLPNRNLLVDRLQVAIADAKRNNKCFVVAFVDLDRFKWINDSLGHKAGDLLLQTMAQRMSNCLRESDAIARIGGDEFVLILPESGNGDESTVLERIITCVSKPVVIDHHQMVVTCSIGCSSYPKDGTNTEALLRFSDTAMFRAKELGRNNVQRYSVELRSRIDERIKLQTELRHALQGNVFKLHYQLQICLKTGVIVGLEALLRWQHPELGNISPARFIPIAEETGMIEAIGDWVIREACRQNKQWQDAGLMKVCIAVNLSAKQLNYPALEMVITESLATTKLDPACLELEWSETASMEDPDKTLLLMLRLKALGITLSIDDFGTGYSNLHYLQRFPVDKLKLDGSFVREITTDPGSLAITDAVISIAHRLGMKVVAEMAETEAQITTLATCGCDYVQGFYFSEPLPPDECAQLLALGRLSISHLKALSLPGKHYR